MNDTSSLNIVPKQSAAKAVPYEGLWRAYYDSLDDNGKKYFGSLNVLEQSRLLDKAISKDIDNNLIKAAYITTNTDPSLSYEMRLADLNKISNSDFNKIKRDLKNDLVNRATYLSSMSKKALDAQKIKETMGVGHMTDEEYLNWLQNIPNPKDPNPNDRKQLGEINKPSDRYNRQIAFNRQLMNVPDNTMDRDAGMKYLIDKQFYYSPDNETVRTADKVLSWIPGANAIVTNRQQGESGIDEVSGRAAKGAGLQLLAVPSALIPEIGPALSGGLAALGTSVAKGERGDNSSNAGLSYLMDTGAGAIAGHLLDKAIGKGVNWLINKGNNPVKAAQQKYDDLMTPMLNELKLNKDQMGSYSNQANSAYTNKINKAIQAGKLSDVDADAFMPNREGGQYIVVPSEIFKNDAKLSELNAAADAAKQRTDYLKKITRTQRPISPGQSWLPQRLDEGGYNPAIEYARGALDANANYEPAVIDWAAAAKAPNKSTLDIIAEKPLWTEIEDYQRTYPQSILKNIAYDSQHGKGQLPGPAGTLAQHDFNQPSLDVVKYQPYKDFIIRNYKSPKAMARDVIDQADSYVAEANDLFEKGELTGDKLKYLAKEYAEWNTRMGNRSTPELRHRYELEFLNKFNAYRHVPEKDNWTRQPYTKIPEHLNQGVDIERLNRNPGNIINFSSGGLRPNPSITGEINNINPIQMITNLADKVKRRNTGRYLSRNPTERAGTDLYAIGEALAHQGDIEVPSQNAVSKYIARANAGKLKKVTKDYEDMKSRYLIPTLQEVSDAEQALIAAKTKPSLKDALKNIAKKPASEIKYNLGGLGASAKSVPYFTRTSLSEPEEESRSEAMQNETSSISKEAKKWIPYYNYDIAKQRGNYIPEYNLDYRLPRKLLLE